MAEDKYGTHVTPYGSHDVAYGGVGLPVDVLDPYAYGSTVTEYGSGTIPYGVEVPELSGFYNFSPPADIDNPPVLMDPREWRRNPLGYYLMRHFTGSPKAVNVYKLADGTYTTTQPIPAIVNNSTPSPAETIVHIYYGATTTRVDGAEAQRLTDAGFPVTDIPLIPAVYDSSLYDSGDVYV